MVEATVVANLADACGESPLWDDKTHCLHWLDITGQRLHRRGGVSNEIETACLPLPASALALTTSNYLLASGAKGVWLMENGELARLLAEECNGLPLAINDSIVDPKGRLLAGSSFFDGSDSYTLGNLYCITGQGAVSVLDTGFKLANGMGFSTDGQTLYVTDSADRRIYAYDYDAAAAQVRNRRLFKQVPAEEGLPDGLSVDADDFVWSAQWFGGCVCRYDPQGVLERRITVPADQTSSLTFGGVDLNEIYITTAAIADALALAPANYRPSQNVGGQLFHVTGEIRGKAEFRFCL